MSASFVIPFDNNPVSTSIKSTSYTVPAGKYAKVSSNIGNLSIDGTAIFPEQGFVASASAGSSSSQTKQYELGFSNGIYITSLYLTVSGSSSFTGTFETSFFTNASGSSVPYIINTLSRTTNGSSSSTLNVYYPVTNFMFKLTVGAVVGGSISASCGLSYYPFIDKTIWVPTGTVISGAKYSVEEYNLIS